MKLVVSFLARQYLIFPKILVEIFAFIELRNILSAVTIFLGRHRLTDLHTSSISLIVAMLLLHHNLKNLVNQVTNELIFFIFFHTRF